jgi:hypothetical protein
MLAAVSRGITLDSLEESATGELELADFAHAAENIGGWSTRPRRPIAGSLERCAETVEVNGLRWVSNGLVWAWVLALHTAKHAANAHRKEKL